MLSSPVGVDYNGIQVVQDVTSPGPKKHGLTVFTTVVFAVGEMAGSGVLALSNALIGTGYIGIALNVMCALVSAFTGVLLGKSWMMVLDKHPETRDANRSPYPTIGQEAFGKVGRIIVTVTINITLFGVSVVFLLLAAENIESLVQELGVHFSGCYWILIVAAALCPFTFPGTPKDFWPIAVGAVSATSLACVLAVAQICIDNREGGKFTYPGAVNMKGFLMSFGAICFAFGGHPAFPTFQADMKNPEDFGKAISISYLVVLIMYLPVAISGYSTYGGNTAPNILASLSLGGLRTVVVILITLHIICSFIIVINPVCQEMEGALRISTRFTWKRIVTRTLMVGAVLFVAESIPHFGLILDLVGGSTTTLLAYILPPLFFLKLSHSESITVPLHIKVACLEVLVIGALAGGGSTYSAISDMVSSSFSTPCYIDNTVV